MPTVLVTGHTVMYCRTYHFF